MVDLINISKNYKTKSGEVQALKDVNINFPDRGMVFILGKSGCGKTTLLNIIGGLDNYTDGEIVVDGVSLKDYKSADYDEYRNKYVGFVFQEYNLLDEFNVEQNIGLALELQKSKDNQALVDKALEDVGLQGYNKRRINELSGGQKQRVAIARAIIKKPSIVLADEPTGNLDSMTAEEIFGILKKLSLDRLIIVVSHDRESAEEYADRIIELKDGAVVNDTFRNRSSATDGSEKEKDKAQKKAGNMPFGRATRYAFSNLWQKKIRVAVSVVLFIITLGLFNFSYATNIFDIYKTVEKTFDKTDEDVVYLNAYNDIKTYDYVEDVFQEEAFPIYVDRLFSLNDSGYEEVVDSVYYDTDLWLSMEINADIAAKLNLQLVCGRLPQNAEEICISEYKAESILYCYRAFCESLGISEIKDFVGKQIDYEGFTIVGIIDTKFPKMYDIVKEMQSFEELNKDENYGISIKFGDEKENKLHDVMFCHKSYYDYYYLPQNFYFEYFVQPESIFYNGTHSQGCNEKYLQLKGIEYHRIDDGEGIMLKERDVRDLLSYRGYITQENDRDILSILRNNVITLDLEFVGNANVQYSFSQRVVGYLGEGASLCLTDGFLEEFYQEVGCVETLAIDPDNREALYRAVELSDLNDAQSTFYFNSIATNELEHAVQYAGLTKQICGIACLVFAVIVILLLLNYFMSTIKDKNKEIGIMRALGVKTGNLIGIYLLQAVIICVIAFLISLPIAYSVADWEVMATMNSMPEGYDVVVNYIDVGFESCTITFLTSLGVALIGCITPFIKLGRMKPIEIIRNK